ncbi:MAG TPA: HAD family hydrolase [Candidatus Eisenbacteria bacterium]|nr:HAD family hydrolase [Candidatus Eisenbacteria bacterium]
MMKQLNVIDLDGTLLPYDSLAAWVRRFRSRRETAILFCWWSGLRRLGLLSRSEFLRLTLERARNAKGYDAFTREFARQLLRDLDTTVQERIRLHSDADTVNLLCSASPEDYVRLVAEALGWEYRASGFRESGEWEHVYGPYKVTLIQRDFPQEQFRYQYAVADSESDWPLLDLFAHSERWARIPRDHRTGATTRHPT